MNIVFNPLLLPYGVFRRNLDLNYPTTKIGAEQRHGKVGPIKSGSLDVDPAEGIPTADVNFWEGLPYPAVNTMKVLGLTIAAHRVPGDHFRDIIAKAQMARGILGRVAK